MKPLQVYIDDAEFVRLEAWSRARGWTKSQAIRAAVRALTRSKDEDSLLSISGIIQDRLPRDCSVHFDRYLQETFVAEKPTPYKKRRHHPSKPARR